jgi:hypothetical protein
MAKKKGKSKVKAKPKAKARPKAKAKPKPKAKPKAKAKSKPKAKAKARAGGPPPGVTPGMCNPFTAQTGAAVIWQNVPSGGCTIDVYQGNPWPFTPGPPIVVPYLNPGQTPNAWINVGTGSYLIDVKCCKSQMPKTVTVP